MVTKNVIITVATIEPINITVETILTPCNIILGIAGCTIGFFLAYYVFDKPLKKWIMKKVRGTKFEHIYKFKINE